MDNIEQERSAFEAWWSREMNVEEFGLWRCEFQNLTESEQPYLSHETNRGWIIWQARAQLAQQQEPVAWYRESDNMLIWGGTYSEPWQALYTAPPVTKQPVISGGLLQEALARIEDLLSSDDGQAFKEARKFAAKARALLAEVGK